MPEFAQLRIAVHVARPRFANVIVSSTRVGLFASR